MCCQLSSVILAPRSAPHLGHGLCPPVGPPPPPFSSQRWVCYQLLLAAAQCHSRGVVHGDIKSENVLLTSWEWVYLADFAAGLKPVALPADNPVWRTG